MKRRKPSISTNRPPTLSPCPSPTATSRCSRGLGGCGSDAMPSLRLAPLADAAPPLFGRSLCRKGLRQGPLRAGAAARRHGLLALWRRRARGGCAQARLRPRRRPRRSDREDARLDAASTLRPEDLRRIWDCFRDGGRRTISRPACASSPTKISGAGAAAPSRAPVRAVRRFRAGAALRRRRVRRTALIAVLSHRLCWRATREPVAALADALARENFRVAAVSSPASRTPPPARLLAQPCGANSPTSSSTPPPFPRGSTTAAACSTRRRAGLPGRAQSGASDAQWRASQRGLSAADLAMNVVLPEVDGRLVRRRDFVQGANRAQTTALEYAPAAHEPEPSRVAYRTRAPRRALGAPAPHAAGEQKLALILSDYPGKGGRAGYAVGLDTFASRRQTIARGWPPEGYAARRHPAGADELARSACKPAAAARRLSTSRLSRACLRHGAARFRRLDRGAMGRAGR